MSALGDASQESIERSLLATRRLLAIKEAREHLLPYLQLLMPDPEAPEDVTRSRYIITPQARLLAEVIEKVAAGKLKRVAVSIGPQFGKSQIISRAAPTWFMGRSPISNAILASYNTDFAKDFGQDNLTIIKSPTYRQVFPQLQLIKGGEAKDLIVTTAGGKYSFVGIGGSGAGKSADYFFVDDPYRNQQDADSLTYRDMVWSWFNSVVMGRIRNKTAILVLHTRYHQDDLIGRLCDPDHPERRGMYAGLEKRWTYINLPAVVTEPKLAEALGLALEPQTDPMVLSQFGSAPMCALYPEEKNLELLSEAKQSDPKVFSALYMGKPSPDEGTYFKKDYILEYNRDELPKRLRYYGASDHAVTAKQNRDYNVIGCVGVDENDIIWVLPDVTFRRAETDVVVDELLSHMKVHEPELWWMENELISKSFGPFLRKRMRQERVYRVIDPVTPAADIEARARSIQGLMALHQVRFPRFSPWWQSAKQQLLNFPAATHNDFVAWLALIGLGIQKQIKPRTAKAKANEPPSGSMAWILKRSEERARKGKRDKETAGW